MTDCWFLCADGHTELWGLYGGFPICGAHLDNWPIGEIDRQYHDYIENKYPTEARDDEKSLSYKA
ncbi:hypothetical protein [Lacticaseibacillus hulanensis]|uniref:hypothetical protein n=1 Tax=Lacticaseibacillus hulanensis TaxID=2493111 RepID=UPI000FDA9D38|nr:hypothetical protein [Lacticaseibacillus hulanensis]